MIYYTTIEQSKKILELGLSRDTADMVYKYNFLLESNDTTPKVVNGNLHDTTLRNIPCWSLGALLDVLPSASLDSSDNHHYRLHCMERFSEWYDSAVGACVDMIEKLHKQNLL